MRFSIQGLLALTLLIALALFAWMTREGALRARARLLELENIVRNLEVQLRVDDPQFHQALLHERDSYQGLHEMRERAVAQFDVLAEKYGGVESRGDDVFSYRLIPYLPTDTRFAPAAYHLLVPNDRAVWLKFGVHVVSDSSNSRSDPDRDIEVLTESTFSVTGPFEIQLAPRLHTLIVERGPADNDSLPVKIVLDDEVLLHTAGVVDGVDDPGFSYSSPRVQHDVASTNELPWLTTGKLSHHQPAGADQGFSVWLSDQASGFAKFPRQ